MKTESEDKVETRGEILENLKNEYSQWALNSRRPFSSMDVILISLRQVELLEQISKQLDELKNPAPLVGAQVNPQ